MEMQVLTEEQVNNLLYKEGKLVGDIISDESEQISDIIREKCIYIDRYQRFLSDDPMVSLEQPDSSDNDWSRTLLNESSYKEIFLLLNKFYNNDSTFDKYINSFSGGFEIMLMMYIINMYYEMLVKRLQGIIRSSDDQVIDKFDISRGFSSNLLRKNKLEQLIDLYGSNDVFGAYKEIEGLFKFKVEDKNKNNNRQNVTMLSRLNRVVYDRDTGDINGYQAIEDNPYTSNDFDADIQGVFVSIAEIRGVLLKYGVDLSSGSNLKIIRNAASHGGFLVSMTDDGIVIFDQSGNSVNNADDNNKSYFSISFLRDLVDDIFSKINKDNELSNRDIEVFSFLEKLSVAMRSSSPVDNLPNINNDDDLQVMFINLIRLSLFTSIQFNTENFWIRLKEDSRDNYFKNISFLDGSDFDDIKRDATAYRDKSKFNVGNNRAIISDSDKELYGLFKSIKNAVGHNNIDCIFGYLICRNDYEKYVEVKLGHENEDVDEASFVSKNHRRISFKVSDWMRFLSNDKFFYSMTRTPEEQEQMINMNM